MGQDFVIKQVTDIDTSCYSFVLLIFLHKPSGAAKWGLKHPPPELKKIYYDFHLHKSKPELFFLSLSLKKKYYLVEYLIIILCLF